MEQNKLFSWNLAFSHFINTSAKGEVLIGRVSTHSPNYLCRKAARCGMRMKQRLELSRFELCETAESTWEIYIKSYLSII